MEGPDVAVIEALGYPDRLDLVLAAGGNPNARDSDGRSALEVSIESNDEESLHKLIAAGAQVNAARPDGWTPLHMAVDYECDTHHQNGLPLDLRMIRPLLDAGADPTAEWTGGHAQDKTPLGMAEQHGHVAAVEAMKQAIGLIDP